MPYRGKTTLLIVAHGTSVADGDPAGVLARQLRPHWNGPVTHAYMRSDPGLRSVLGKMMQAGQTARLVVVPLFFSAGYLVNDELPAILNEAGLRHAMVLPPVTGLHGFIPMVADCLATTLAARNWQAGETTLFLVPHGLKSLKEPSDEQIWQAQRIANVVPELSVKIANVEGQPSLGDWRSMADRPHSMFLPLLAGGGVHARTDVPEMMALTEADEAVVLSPIGIWPELPPLILDQAQKRTRHAVVLANFTTADKFVSQSVPAG
ncbi:sirohydrochlorin chelatase [Thalassospira sp.]|uniref:sirohydrochlorin chelatase n=1 Tax=Thalassospira sp. TaxID=1912094 RepID=UPI003AA8AC9A